MKDFLNRLWRGYEGEAVFDPWNDRAGDDAGGHSISMRRELLAMHLACPNPRLLLVGEAPGFRGCRVTGVPFTSERLLFANAIPRLSLGGMRLSTAPRPWAEPSATIMWRALYDEGLAETTLLWNAFPWHPFNPGRGAFSNRTPAPAEQQAGLVVLRGLIDALPKSIEVAAVGNIAGAALDEIAVPHVVLRHPANGGAGKLRAGLHALAATVKSVA